MKTRATLALCQDCGWIHEGSTPEILKLHQTSASCHCGGDVCACSSCVEDAQAMNDSGMFQQVSIIELAQPGQAVH